MKDKQSAKLLKKLSEDIWPLERDLMIRPDRYRYVRKIVKPKGCVFCKAAKAKPSMQSLKVFETPKAMVVLNKYPYNSGHVLVLPKNHGGELTEISIADYQELMAVLKLTVEVVQSVYQCSGLNIGLNHGAVAGAGIPDHLHWHVIPRWSGDVNFFPMVAETKVVIEATRTTYKKLKKAFSSRELK